MSGGDGYTALKAASEGPEAQRTTLPEREQQTLIEYVDRVLGRHVDLPEPARTPRIVRVGG
jgi:hypothetical protein